MTHRQVIAVCSVAACVLTLSACGGASAGLDLHFDPRASTWRDVARRVSNTPTAPPNDAAVVLSISASEPPYLIAHDLTGVERWRTETTADAVIHVAGASIVTAESGSLVVRDAESGRRMFAYPLGGMSLLGAAREADTLAWIAAAPSITTTAPASRIVVVHATTGQVRWERSLNAALGAPVMRGGILIAPWNRQGLTAIDARDGHELARLHANQISVDWVEATAAGIVYGNDDVHDLSCTDANAGCVALPSPLAEAPSHPTLHRSAYRTPDQGGIRTIFDLTRLPDGHLSYADDRAYLVFYRYVFAFDGNGALSWVRLLGPDVFNAQAFAGGIALVDANGQVLRLRATDGAPLSAADPAITAQPESLRDALLRVALDPDNRLVVARAYAVQVLAQDPDPTVTQQLLDAYEQRSTPSGLRAVIAQALLTRRTGSEHLIAALVRHHDFLDDVTPPPLSVVVPALVAMDERRAVPALLEHLRDPATSAEDVAVVADALGHLADRSLARWIVDWLRSYRASMAFAGHPDVVVALARAARSISDFDAAPSLAAIAEANGTQPVIAHAIIKALRTTDDGPVPSLRDRVTASTTSAERRLEQREINAVFAARIDAIRACIVPELVRNPTLAQVRIAFVTRADGSAHGFAYAPSGAAFSTCMNPVTQDLKLTPFDGDATVATYVIRLRSAPSAADAVIAATPESAAEWWSWYAREMPPAFGAPWWSRYVAHDLDWLPPTSPPTHAAPASAPQPTTPPAATPTPAADDAWWLPSQP